MRLPQALDAKKMDLRLRDKLVHEGKLTAKEVENYFESLPDDSDLLTVVPNEDDEQNSSDEQDSE